METIHDEVGFAIIAVLAVVAFLNPFSGMLFLVASQVIPDPPGAGIFTVARFGVVGFTIVRLLKGNWRFGSITKQFILAGLPFVAWVVLCQLMNQHIEAAEPIVLAFIVGLIGADLVDQAQERAPLCLICILLGALLAASYYWLLKSGVQPAAFTLLYSNLGDSAQFYNSGDRIGAGRGNCELSGPNDALALVGLISVLAQFRSFLPRLVVLVAVSLICVPPLIGAASRAGMVIAMVGLCVLLIYHLMFSQGQMESANFLFSIAGVAVMVGALLLSPLDKVLGIKYSLSVLADHTESVGGNSNLLAGRDNVWFYGAKAVASYPLFGVPPEAVVDIPAEYEDNPEFFCSHNTFIDAGLVGGIIGMILFGWFLIQPLRALLRPTDGVAHITALVTYFEILLMISVGSLINLKTLWLLWPLAIAIGQGKAKGMFGLNAWKLEQNPLVESKEESGMHRPPFRPSWRQRTRVTRHAD